MLRHQFGAKLVCSIDHAAELDERELPAILPDPCLPVENPPLGCGADEKSDDPHRDRGDDQHGRRHDGIDGALGQELSALDRSRLDADQRKSANFAEIDAVERKLEEVWHHLELDRMPAAFLDDFWHKVESICRQGNEYFIPRMLTHQALELVD